MILLSYLHIMIKVIAVDKYPFAATYLIFLILFITILSIIYHPSLSTLKKPFNVSAYTFNSPLKLNIISQLSVLSLRIHQIF